MCDVNEISGKSFVYGSTPPAFPSAGFPSGSMGVKDVRLEGRGRWGEDMCVYVYTFVY